jgi:hypothetical protein
MLNNQKQIEGLQKYNIFDEHTIFFDKNALND